MLKAIVVCLKKSDFPKKSDFSAWQTRFNTKILSRVLKLAFQHSGSADRLLKVIDRRLPIKKF